MRTLLLCALLSTSAVVGLAADTATPTATPAATETVRSQDLAPVEAIDLAATLGTCQVTCKKPGSSLVRLTLQTTWLDCCEPSISPCDDGYTAVARSFNGLRCVPL